jgi:hypothetical protein
MNIRNTINRLIVDEIIRENAATNGKSPTGLELQRLAMAAIITGQRDAGGAITDAWREYMTFLLTGTGGGAANPDDLRRLLPEDDSTGAEQQKERAYLVGNGMCGTGTGDGILLNGNPTTVLDQ